MGSRGRRRTAPDTVLAERVGFEPTVRLRVRRISSVRFQPLSHPSNSTLRMKVAATVAKRLTVHQLKSVLVPKGYSMLPAGFQV